MALLFMDSFDHYATADMSEKWTAVGGTGTVAIGATGRNSTQGFSCPTNNLSAYATATVLGGVDEVIIGAAVKVASKGPSEASGFFVLGSASVWECGLMILPDLTLRPFRVTSASYNPGTGTQYYATYIGSASAVSLQLGVWAYIELRMKVHDTLGTCIVRVNGLEALNLTGLDTLYTTNVLTRFALAGESYNPNNYFSFVFDDLVVMDTTGALNNSFIGDVTISAIYPSGAGNSSGWTPSAGSNYQNVDEATPNDDTDYNSTSTLNAKDLYTFADAPAGADIRAVQVLAAVRKGAEGPGQVKLVTRSNSADYDSVAKGIGGTSYSYVRQVLEADPGSGSPLAAWTESGFNAAEFGIKKTG